FAAAWVVVGPERFEQFVTGCALPLQCEVGDELARSLPLRVLRVGAVDLEWAEHADVRALLARRRRCCRLDENGRWCGRRRWPPYCWLAAAVSDARTGGSIVRANARQSGRGLCELSLPRRANARC